MNLKVIVKRRLMIICFFFYHYFLLLCSPRGQSCCNERFSALETRKRFSLTIYLSWYVNVVIFSLASFRFNWQDHLCELWANIEP